MTNQRKRTFILRKREKRKRVEWVKKVEFMDVKICRFKKIIHAENRYEKYH